MSVVVERFHQCSARYERRRYPTSLTFAHATSQCACAAGVKRAKMADKVETPSDSGEGFISRLATELFTSPVNLVLLGVCSVLVYKIFFSRKREDSGPPPEPQLPRMKRRDFTLEQLREFDGKRADGRLLIAVNGKVFDVTRGKRFYGPGKVWKSSLSRPRLPLLCVVTDFNRLKVNVHGFIFFSHL